MRSTKLNDSNSHLPAPYDWRSDGLRYYSYNRYLRAHFGGRVQKVSIDAGFTCPNVDGSVTTGGCTFCDNRSFSPSRRIKRQAILDQINEGIRRLKLRYKCNQFLAYFQPATNTYAAVDKLRSIYWAALEHPDIVGMAIGTRPDCVADDVLDLLEELAQETYLTVEYGIQTLHEKSLEWMNRGHGYDVFPDAVARSKGRGFEICAHVIVGLPGEDHNDIMATAEAMAGQELDAIKIHNLYAVKNTKLGEQVTSGEVQLMGRDEYVSTAVDFIERLPPSVVIERITGDAPGDYFIGPEWCLDKSRVLIEIQEEFERRDTWQGKLYSE